MDRDIISNTLQDELGEKLLDKLFDYMEQGKNTREFILQYYNETALIYNTYDDKWISWYKLTHIGRAFNTNIIDINDFELFCNDLKEALENNA